MLGCSEVECGIMELAGPGVMRVVHTGQTPCQFTLFSTDVIVASLVFFAVQLTRREGRWSPREDVVIVNL